MDVLGPGILSIIERLKMAAYTHENNDVHSSECKNDSVHSHTMEERSSFVTCVDSFSISK